MVAIRLNSRVLLPARNSSASGFTGPILRKGNRLQRQCFQQKDSFRSAEIVPPVSWDFPAMLVQLYCFDGSLTSTFLFAGNHRTERRPIYSTRPSHSEGRSRVERQAVQSHVPMTLFSSGFRKGSTCCASLERQGGDLQIWSQKW
jgi:hypothetical protein